MSSGLMGRAIFDGCIIYKVKHSRCDTLAVSTWDGCQGGKKLCFLRLWTVIYPGHCNHSYIFCAALWIMLQELNPLLRKSVWKNELFWNSIAECCVCKF